MTKLEQLKNAKDIHDFAKLIGYKPKSISYILYQIPEEKKYIEFEIPKKNGEKRKIKAPNEMLKSLQGHLCSLLTECDEEIRRGKNKKVLAHGFCKNHSIYTNAYKHRNKRYIVNIDIKDFFPTFNFGRVRGYFIKNRDFKLEEKIATYIAQIACYKNQLPQGSPCSPIISNMIGHILDVKMVQLAKNEGFTYSRYADDLTFSTNNNEMSSQIAFQNEVGTWSIGYELDTKIKECGFSPNLKKFSVQYKTSRQMTTGLVVNQKVNIRKEYYKNTRSMCSKLFTTGKFFTEKIKTEDDEIIEKVGTLNQLEGRLNFIYYTKKYNQERSQNKESKDIRVHGINKLYRQFLYYKYFFNNDKPLIITEGKTDITYLTCALKSLSEEFPELIKKNENKYEYNIQFFNISEYLRDIFSIVSGTSGLAYLAGTYNEMMNHFKTNGMNNPVIIITDNDKGLKPLSKHIKEQAIDPKNNYHICKNLYVLFSTKKKGTEIESLFDDEVLKGEIKGKKFSPKKNPDDSKYYGKYLFSEEIIRKNQNKINFSGFKQIFKDIEWIIEEHKKKNA